MPASFTFAQTTGAGSGTRADIGATGNVFNFKDVDDATPANYATNPIVGSDTADQGRSYEIYLQPHFTGTFNTINNLRFWMSTDFSPNTGLAIKAKMDGVEAYTAPVKTDSAVAVDAIPTSDPGTANVSIGGEVSGALTAEGYADYIVLQLDVASTAAPGDTSLAEFTFMYDES